MYSVQNIINPIVSAPIFGAAVNALGTHDSPDFMLIGDLSSFKDYGGYHTYKLHIAIHDLSTGKVVWQGIQTKIKL